MEHKNKHQEAGDGFGTTIIEKPGEEISRAITLGEGMRQPSMESNPPLAIKGDLISFKNPRRQMGIRPKTMFALSCAVTHCVYVKS